MDKSMMIGIAIVAIIVIAGGAYLLVAGHTANHSNIPATTTTQNGNSSTSIIQHTNSTTSLAPTTTASQSQVYAVTIENSSKYGTYLANASGYTLYTYSGDTANSKTSSCNGSCASNWPPFYVSNLMLQPGLNATNFGIIKRSDGSMQTTYKGMPLYRFLGDTNPSEVAGNGVAGFSVATK